MVCENLQSGLEHIAADLRPAEQQFVPVLEIAHRLGVRVCVRLSKECRRPAARIEIAANPPTIYVTRRSPVEGGRILESHEDRLLSPRERFSVAHELGHLVAFRELKLTPSQEKSEYWTHEGCMHSFAAALLMPEWLLDGWLSSLPAGEPVSPFALRCWARDVTRLSEEVVATQLCLRRPEIGFMKVSTIRRRRDKCKVLRVLFAASGDRVSLPKTHSHVENKYLLERLAAESTGMATIRQCALGTCEPQDISIVWRHAGFFKAFDQDFSMDAAIESIPIYWISAAFQKSRAEHQLALW